MTRHTDSSESQYETARFRKCSAARPFYAVRQFDELPAFAVSAWDLRENIAGRHWALQGLNLRLRPCEERTLPLS